MIRKQPLGLAMLYVLAVAVVAFTAFISVDALIGIIVRYVR